MVLSIRIAVSKSLCFRINSVHKNVSFWTCIFLWNYMCSWVLFASVQFSHSVLSNSVTPWTAACQASLSIINSRDLLKLMSIESVMPSNHLIFCHPLLLQPPIFLSIRVFSNESAPRMRWPKYWSFSFSISTSNEHPRLISLRMDWFYLLSQQFKSFNK